MSFIPRRVWKSTAQTYFMWVKYLDNVLILPRLILILQNSFSQFFFLKPIYNNTFF